MAQIKGEIEIINVQLVVLNSNKHKLLDQDR